jgi:DNA-binding LacI/PurR family transcriptional regulator
LTTCRQPREQIAQEAVRLLTEPSARRVALSPELVVRESTGAVPHRDG